jgi:5-methylcytosine-specific restriction endonuclease McrA
MAKDFAKQFYSSKAWQQCRDSYISKVYGVCERCGGVGYIVHHKILLTPDNINNPEVTLNHDHLEYLCQTCHNSEHLGSELVREGLKWNEWGELVEVYAAIEK